MLIRNHPESSSLPCTHFQLKKKKENSHPSAMTIQIQPIRLFRDNYCWMIQNLVSKSIVLVDPAQASVCKAAIETHPNFTLAGILATHHHSDHAGGNIEMKNYFPTIEVVGGKSEKKMPGPTKTVEDGETFVLGDMKFKAIFTPCHTLGHVSYYLEDAKAVFTGDTLFTAGCGKFFEGDAKMMHGSLAKLASLPKETKVFCGHEYTVSNLNFCLHVEPNNEKTKERMRVSKEKRERDEPTVPSTLQEEFETNVFLRCKESSVIAFAQKAGCTDMSPQGVLQCLRESKNNF